jgi:hypothetical protein
MTGFAWKFQGSPRGISIEHSREVDRQDESTGGASVRPIRFRHPNPQHTKRRSSDHLTAAASWRAKRLRRLRALANSLADLRWSSDLLNRLVYELRIEEDFAAVIADPAETPIRRYPQAVAIAIALRHSWRPDLFARVSRELRRISRLEQHRRSRRRSPRRSPKPSHLSRRALP